MSISLVVLVPVVVDAQLTSPIGTVCPGNLIKFTCQQNAALSRWTISLQQPLTITVQNPLVESIHTFAGDSTYDFRLHVISII